LDQLRDISSETLKHVQLITDKNIKSRKIDTMSKCSINKCNILLKKIFKLDEEIYSMVSSNNNLTNEMYNSIHNRLHTEFGRLSSFISWPDSILYNPIHLTKLGLYN
jgi:hypothetical protein